jgi:hypothetical protein
VRLRRDLDVGAFGVSAAFQKKAGERLIREHDEANPGADQHEELYVVVQGSATFTVDGEEIEAPQGTTVFVRDPASKRGATATADNTIVVSVGGRRGEAYRLAPAAAATASTTRTRRRTTRRRSRRRIALSRRIPAMRTCSTTSHACQPYWVTAKPPSRRSPSRSPSGSRSRKWRARTMTS